MPGEPSRNADASAQEPDNQGVTLPDNLNFTADTEAHCHQAVQRFIGGLDVPHYAARTGRQLA